jgi:hypothetical protein
MKRSLQVILVALPLFALAASGLAQRKNDPSPTSDALVRLLRSKGILTAEEATAITEESSPAESQHRLARLLLSKGVITQEEYERAVVALAVHSAQEGHPAPDPVIASASVTDVRIGSNLMAALPAPASSSLITAGSSGPGEVGQPAKSEAAPVIPAVVPLRLLPITIPEKNGLVPDIKLGAGARLQPYGFFKISAPHQTASHGGPTFGSNDFIQGPLLLGDTGPTGDGQFHIKNRALRMGVNFEWPDPTKNLTLTGKLEFDFEGDFTNVNNRNISSVRSSMPSLRLAWARLDTKFHDHPVFIQLGQDWSIFGSSTLMDIFETTGFGFAQGNLYERMPMIRTGVQFQRKDLKIQPELALALPSFGEPNLTDEQRARFGGRVGSESEQPEFQSRLVLEFPFSHAPGVAPAQIIFSYDHAQRAETVEAASLPNGPIKSAFPNGLRLTSNRNAWTAEAQLPTQYVTVVGKYYRGGDLRFYFQGQFNDVFADLGTAPSIGSALSFAGRSIPFGIVGGGVTAPTLEPVMGQGGFLQLGFPVSRLFHADPGGRNAGWALYATYGVDSAFAKDAIRANGLLRTDHFSLQMRYKFNRWVSFVHEQTYLDTRTAGRVLKSFRGTPAHTTHAWRSEAGALFTF